MAAMAQPAAWIQCNGDWTCIEHVRKGWGVCQSCGWSPHGWNYTSTMKEQGQGDSFRPCLCRHCFPGWIVAKGYNPCPGTACHQTRTQLQNDPRFVAHLANVMPNLPGPLGHVVPPGPPAGPPPGYMAALPLPTGPAVAQAPPAPPGPPGGPPQGPPPPGTVAKAPPAPPGYVEVTLHSGPVALAPAAALAAAPAAALAAAVERGALLPQLPSKAAPTQPGPQPSTPQSSRRWLPSPGPSPQINPAGPQPSTTQPSTTQPSTTQPSSKMLAVADAGETASTISTAASSTKPSPDEELHRAYVCIMKLKKSGETRIHPNDEQRIPYTFAEFLEHYCDFLAAIEFWLDAAPH